MVHRKLTREERIEKGRETRRRMNLKRHMKAKIAAARELFLLRSMKIKDSNEPIFER